MTPAREALARLRAGNRRYVTGAFDRAGQVGQARRDELLGGQRPFAIILGCSDSRVPVEIIFDQGLGDLFVVRVAGNIAAPAQTGSIELAVQHCGARLVVVLGHTRCGAVQAAFDALHRPQEPLSPGLREIVDRIDPLLTGLLATDLRHDQEALLHEAMLANVRATADRLRQDSAVIAHAIQRDGLVVVGAEYSLATGVVDFFDGVPSDA